MIDTLYAHNQVYQNPRNLFLRFLRTALIFHEDFIDIKILITCIFHIYFDYVLRLLITSGHTLVSKRIYFRDDMMKSFRKKMT